MWHLVIFLFSIAILVMVVLIYLNQTGMLSTGGNGNSDGTADIDPSDANSTWFYCGPAGCVYLLKKQRMGFVFGSGIPQQKVKLQSNGEFEFQDSQGRTGHVHPVSPKELEVYFEGDDETVRNVLVRLSLLDALTNKIG